jgi:hypothetical protein
MPARPPTRPAAHDPLHWVLRQRVIRANGNGTTNTYLHQIVRVLTEEGARQLADYRLPYWRGEQRARLLSCTIFSARRHSAATRPARRFGGHAEPAARRRRAVEGRIDDLRRRSSATTSASCTRSRPPRRFAGAPTANSSCSPIRAATTAPGEPRRPPRPRTTRCRRHAAVPLALQDLPRDVPELRRPERKELEPVVRMTTYRDWDHFARGGGT